MYFKGSLFSVGEHIIADVPRSGLAGAEPEDEEKKKEKRKKNGGRGGIRPSHKLFCLEQ